MCIKEKSTGGRERETEREKERERDLENVCPSVYIYIYIYTHTHTHTHIYIYIYISISLSLSLPPSLPLSRVRACVLEWEMMRGGEAQNHQNQPRQKVRVVAECQEDLQPKAS